MSAIPSIPGAPMGDALDVLWGKSSAGGQPLALIQHLFDTAAVGELIWDRFLASAVRTTWDAASAGAGRQVFARLCGLHDIGKASPAFQDKVPGLASVVATAGLGWRPLSSADRTWHHTLAGAKAALDELSEAGLSVPGVQWV